MQPCFRRTECLLCTFRQHLQWSLGPGQRRSYWTSPKLQFTENGRRKERTGRHHSNHVRGSNHRQSGPRPQFRAFQPDHEISFSLQEQKRFVEKVHKVLANISNSLRQSSREDGVDSDYFNGVVKDKTQWTKFENMVKELAEIHAQSRPQHEGRFTKRWSAIDTLKKQSARPSWSQEMTRTVKFWYVDQVMQEDGLLTSGPRSDFIDLRYPTEWYSGARCLQRHIHLHVGPTNSGKTYNALKRLQESKNGFYAGPLRLLAHEVYSRFNDRGIECELVTGDDVRLSDDKVDMYCSTVEMVDINRPCDVGVIDEIQMIASEERGWAWTRALLGSRVKELHLCGEARVVPLIRELVASMGDTLHLHQYDRLNPLKVMSQSLKGNLKNLRKGDCIVSFSVVNIHALKKQIERETGRRVAIVYGSLPPETRAQQADLFNNPDNDYDYLVASDAIGMGLNLSIKRVVFETTMRYNGSFRERLSIPQIKQIAGRAGRYRTSNDDKMKVDAPKPDSKPPVSVGLVTCLDEHDLPIISEALKTEAPPIKAAGLLPIGELYERASLTWPKGIPFEYIMHRIHQIVSLNPRFTLCAIDDQLQIARAIDDVPNLSIRERLFICASPAQIKSRAGQDYTVLIAIAKAIASKQTITVCDIPEIPLEILDEPLSPSREYLESLEILHKTLNLYLWLHYRFAGVLTGKDMTIRAKELTEEKINACLVNYSANPKLTARLAKIRKASALLRAQTGKEAELEAEDMTINPDASVEEVERRAREDAQQLDIDNFVNDEPGSVKGRPQDQRALTYEWGKPDEPAIMHDEPDKIRDVSKGTG